MKPYPMISITLFSLILLILPVHLAGAPVSIRETCKAAKKVVSNIDYNFCVSTLNQSSTTAASDTRVFANISVTAAASHVHNVSTIIQDLLRRSPDPDISPNLKYCNDSYYHVTSSLDKALEAINEKNDDVAKSSLSEGLNGVISCETEFEMAGKPSPLMELDVISVELVTLTYGILEVAEKNK
ncbi:Plant invertase/pectin methylesterase inhibitor protein [Dioscorea alata]|uniref:Plant invertase/pectin methylesterase inhibitor protein n=1 Tax=Dioscorea alata TaxID=55571 RepID=A0ACB7UFU7_DIOAL|nr:Plant invertase/pectin methylesterase inhibitor protein [Dioscorea alata]